MAKELWNTLKFQDKILDTVKLVKQLSFDKSGHLHVLTLGFSLEKMEI